MNIKSLYEILVFAMSTALFVLMGVDKARAIRGKWRISEKFLFLLAFSGGGLGGLMGMLSFRHKTKHCYFVVGFTLLAALQLAALMWLTIRPIYFGG